MYARLRVWGVTSSALLSYSLPNDKAGEKKSETASPGPHHAVSDLVTYIAGRTEHDTKRKRATNLVLCHAQDPADEGERIRWPSSCPLHWSGSARGWISGYELAVAAGDTVGNKERQEWRKKQRRPTSHPQETRRPGLVRQKRGI